MSHHTLAPENPTTYQLGQKSTVEHKLPWYRGLWWTIWLTIFATVLIYGLGTALYFRFVIAPSIELAKQELKSEQEAYYNDFREYIQQQSAQYTTELYHWRDEMEMDAPPPQFGYREKARTFNESYDAKNRAAHEQEHSDPENPINTWVWLSLMIFVMGIATFPVSRRLTRRLEKLQKGVEALGSGTLDARVEVTGKDEIALLAQSFNASAEHIEYLVTQHKDLLAQVSHEFRTPLARLRMSAELITAQAPEVALELRTDIKELDELVEEILLASRLDAVPDLLQVSSFDALALAAEEAARTHAELEGESIEIMADETLVRRAIRNLLVNAKNYAPEAPATISVTLEKGKKGSTDVVCFSVADQGSGLKAIDSTKIFEAFFRVKKIPYSPSGTGLGLSLVKQIAHRHGGSATYRPQPEGTGCIFELRIPIVQATKTL